MSGDEYPSERLANLMAHQGGVILFNLDLSNVNKAVFCCAKIDDAVIPETIMVSCTMIFCHNLTWCEQRKITTADLERWTDQLLEGIVFKPDSVPGLREDEIDVPTIQISGGAGGANNHLHLIVKWGFVQSKHCVQSARSLERAYARIG
jgi:hypothetical protein